MPNPDQSRLVVLVEDSDDDAFFFERAFAGTGVEAEYVRLTDGGSAVAYLDRVASSIPDFTTHAILFLDLKLPVLSGFEVLRCIRERQLDLDVVILSGSELEADVRLARDLGARDYLVKPISATELKRWVLAAHSSSLP